MKKITTELAEKEVFDWLSYKRVDEEKIEDNKEVIKTLTNGISNGYLVLDENKNFVLNLKFPVGKDENIKKLSFKPRLKMSEIHDVTRNIKTGDTSALLLAYVSALTSENSAILKELDTEDNRIAQAISMFFL